MKKIILGTMVATSIFAAQIVEIACDKSYKPYSYKDGKEAKGIYVDVIRKAVSQMPNYEVKFKPAAWNKAVNAVKKGKAIGFFPPYYSKARESWMRYSEALGAEKVYVIAKESTHKGKAKFPEDFKGLTACINRGYGLAILGGKKFEQMIKDKTIKLKNGNTTKVCLNQIKSNKADFTLYDRLIDISGFPMLTHGLNSQSNNSYIGFTLKDKKFPYQKDFETKFNKIIKKMRASGDIEKIINSYKKK